MRCKGDTALTIPRLELCAAVLLTKLMIKVIRILSHELSPNAVLLWTDSRIVLDWIHSPPLKGNVFARNRAQFIRENANGFTWRHIQSSLNPADLLSRGVKPKDLLNSDIWWHGPQFLTSETTSWPNGIIVTVNNAPALVCNPCSSYLNERECSYYSSFQKLLRVMAYVLYFITCLKSAKSRLASDSTKFTESLSAHQLNYAKLTCVKIIQHHAFLPVFKALNDGATCPSSSGLVSLNPFIDNNGCLRVGGRISEAELSFDTLHPLILPSQHHLTRALIYDAHLKLAHANVQLLTVYLRQSYWIISIRKTIKSVIRKRITCFRHAPTSAQQLMGNLPAIRVTPSPTFGIVGVDYTGHFWLKHGIRGKSRTKVYLALFVCMVTKAVHIEIVSSLTSEAFLMALKRFVSRRGIPTKIFSDNATTFVGANTRLHALYNLFKSLAFQKQIIEFCYNSSIDWTFIPPRSPHVGGIWEAGIKILKRHLLREIGEAVLSYEELLTAVTHVEAILNSRPLIRPTDDAAEFNYLTPAHFLIGRPLMALPDPNALQQQSVRCHWNRTIMHLPIFGRAGRRSICYPINNAPNGQLSLPTSNRARPCC